jgi:selenocysteine lyase/cysteine desulfurase
VDCEELGNRLGSLGVCARAGLHCAPLAHKSAGTLETGTLRLSFSAFNRLPELPRVERAFRQALRTVGA